MQVRPSIRGQPTGPEIERFWRVIRPAGSSTRFILFGKTSSPGTPMVEQGHHRPNHSAWPPTAALRDQAAEAPRAANRGARASGTWQRTSRVQPLVHSFGYIKARRVGGSLGTAGGGAALQAAAEVMAADPAAGVCVGTSRVGGGDNRRFTERPRRFHRQSCRLAHRHWHLLYTKHLRHGSPVRWPLYALAPPRFFQLLEFHCLWHCANAKRHGPRRRLAVQEEAPGTGSVPHGHAMGGCPAGFGTNGLKIRSE